MKKAAQVDRRTFVAVGIEVEECRKTVEWVAKNAATIGGNRIVLLHFFPPTLARLRQEQKQKIDEVLCKYEAICAKKKLKIDKLAIEKDNIGKGIIQQVYKLRIEKLVMGAAADKHYSRNMSMPTSEKANIVLKRAHHACCTWFICNGNLVYTSRPYMERLFETESDGISPSQPSPSYIDRYFETASPLTVTESPLFKRTRPLNVKESPPSPSYMASPLYVMESPPSPSYIERLFETDMERIIETESDRSSRNVPEKERILNQVYKQLEKAMAEGEIAQREAKAAEASYTKEMLRRKEIEEQLESLRIEQLQVTEELQQKLSAAEGLLVTVQRERDELLRKSEDAVREEEEMRRKRNQKGAAWSLRRPLNFTEYRLSELKAATNNLGIEIGRGGYGSVYKGQLGETEVAVKMLDSQSMQGGFEFQQEVDVLSKVRHPNLVALIGACPEHRALVYEYLPNGSLKDRLACKGDNTPLSWQIRTRIAFEICLALSFLHTRKPHSIVHGDLKPDNILLDSNLVSKLGDFGLCRLILRGEDSKATVRLLTGVKGTIGYIDPEFAATGELTPRSDVYSYGVVLLQLLTGKPATGLRDIVEEAMNKNDLHTILDQKAGGWPFVQAGRLADIALKCCKVKRRSRPDLATVVCKFLEKMMTSVGSSASCSQLSTSLDSARIPSHFVCPISLEIMKDPHVAADGFTYEAEEIRKWLDNCNTSPMTNIPLSHAELIPNRTLKSAIQEWLQVQQS